MHRTKERVQRSTPVRIRCAPNRADGTDSLIRRHARDGPSPATRSRSAAMLVILLAAALAGCRAYDPSVFDARLRSAVFDRYWGALDRDYPFFEQAGVDWDEVRLDYRRPVIQAATRSEFYHRLAGMFARLNDAHVNLRLTLEHYNDQDQGCSAVDLELARIEGRYYVVGWPEEARPEAPAALRAGGFVYPELLAIDGAPCTIQLAGKLLAGPAGSRVRLRLRWPNGITTVYSLQRPAASPPSTAPARDRRDRLRMSAKPVPTFDGKGWLTVQRDRDVGYLRIRTLNPDKVKNLGRDEMVAQFDDAVDGLMDTTGLVIDLQNNTGGRAELTTAIAGRFFDSRTLFGRFHGKFLGLFPATQDSTIKPREPIYTGRIAVLINGYTGSAAEHLAWVFQRTGRGILIGETTYGAEAGVIAVRAPDGTILKFGKYRITDRDGQGFQGRGVVPDVNIPLTLESTLQGGFERANEDVSRRRLQRAIEWLSGEKRDHAIEPFRWKGSFSTRLPG
ncbi:MAG: hypothetical protein IH986_06455 [Planctomycetes bacterium]|nr:hypothetical protein [Planctomycetota bacterium]